MVEKEQLLSFINFIKLKKLRRTNFILLSFFFLLLPTQNYYTRLEIPAGRPVVRQLDIEPPQISYYPVNKTDKPVPALTAYSVTIIDVASKAVIYSINPDYKLPPASTTKIMTALVALDYWHLDDVLKVKTVYNLGQTIGLEKNEEVSLENLLYGLLVQSGNDAAFCLAENYPGGEKEFVKEMNIKGKKLNLFNTSFKNPTGVDDWGHYTSVHDLAILAAEAIKNEAISKIVATPKITVTDISGQISHELENINELVGKVTGVEGVKTGWTEQAGECLISLTKRNDRAVITVVLGSQDRFKETEMLIDWIFNNFVWQPTDTNHQ